MIMLEYPSRSNLNCLIQVLSVHRQGVQNSLTYIGLSTSGYRENHYHLWKVVDSNHSRKDLIYSQVAVSERLLLSNLYFKQSSPVTNDCIKFFTIHIFIVH
jgi:hypothetical protein